MEYLAPTRLDDALAAIAQRRLIPVAGGTDYYPSRVGRAAEDSILDLSRLSELRGIDQHHDHIRIGALTTWAEIARGPLPDGCRSLQQAARLIGAVQVQNAGTIGGNLCNASPAADGIPPLLTLEAEVELASHGSVRRLALDRFVLGYRRTDLRPDELLTAVILPIEPSLAASAFVKLGSRTHLVISIAMAAVNVELSGSGSIAAARVAVGACSPVALRLPLLESALTGVAPEDVASRLHDGHFRELTPIDDPRAPAAYRMQAARVLVGRALAEAVSS